MLISPNNQSAILSLLEAGKTPVLPFEYEQLSEQLARYGTDQLQLGRLLGDAMEQSSETWHDNSPAEAAHYEANLLNKKAEQVISGLGAAALIDYPNSADDKVTLGSLVGIRYQDDDEEFRMLLTGFCRKADVKTDERHDYEVITIKSPVGSALIGKMVGQQIEYLANNRLQRASVSSLVQLGFADLELTTRDRK